MKKAFMIIAIFSLIVLSVSSANAELNNFLSNLNIQATTDMHSFGVNLSAQFGVPLPRVQTIIKTVEFPADAFMCLQLGLMTGIQPESVVNIYKKNMKNGWGAIAKELGIKPGSAEFHALKNGEFTFIDHRTGNTSHGKGKGNNKDKGKGKGHNKQ